MSSSIGPTYTSERQLDNQTYDIRIYDLEPAGIQIQAKLPGDPTQAPFVLNPTKAELTKANILKNTQGYETLVSSLTLAKNEYDQLELRSSLSPIKPMPPRATAKHAESYLTSAPAGNESLPDLLARALTELCREKPVGLDAVEWLGKWLLRNNPNQPEIQSS